MRLRLGVVGLGTWAATGHLPVYKGQRLRDHVEVVALCSRNLEKARAWASHYSVCGAYNNLDRLIEGSAPDVIVVCTPDDAHVKSTLTALNADCDVLVEKPLAHDLAGLEAIRNAVATSGRSVITLFHKRADPLWAEAASRVMSDRYGQLQFGSAVIQNPTDVPHGSYFSSDMASHTEPNLFLGTHFYDLLRYITGLNPVRVLARRFDGGAAFKADLQMENGASVSVACSWNLPTGSPTLTKQHLHLHFSDGEIEIDATRRGYSEHSPSGYAYVNPYFLRSTPAGPVGYGATFLEEAVMSLAGVTVPSVQLPSVEDAWWATATAVAARQSADQGSVIEVSPPRA